MLQDLDATLAALLQAELAVQNVAISFAAPDDQFPPSGASLPEPAGEQAPMPARITAEVRTLLPIGGAIEELLAAAEPQAADGLTRVRAACPRQWP